MNNQTKTIKLTEEAYINLMNLLILNEVHMGDIIVVDCDSDDEVNVTTMIENIQKGIIKE